MVALYVTSTERGVGKTAVAAALGKQLQESRKKVGYFKPRTTADSDPDASSVRQLLGLKESADVLSPVVSDAKSLSSAYALVSRGKDVVIVEGIAGKPDNVVTELDARVILVAAYSSNLSAAGITAATATLGKNLLGFVVTKVPRSRIEDAQKELSGGVASGVRLLGVVPENRTLAALTVSELAQRVGGELMSTGDTAGLVEDFMVGAMGLDSGLTYFNRKVNKAVIVRVDRPDMQMAALETPTRCLIITDDKAPIPVVVNRAKQKKVPIIMVKDDIKATLSRVEHALDAAPFSQRAKLTRMMEIMQSRFDFAFLYQGLGIATK